jgi:hypothetical protein
MVTKRFISAGASPVLVSEIDADTLFEVWSNGDHWAAIITKSDGTSCPITEGDGPVALAPPVCVDPVRCPRV